MLLENHLEDTKKNNTHTHVHVCQYHHAGEMFHYHHATGEIYHH